MKLDYLEIGRKIAVRRKALGLKQSTVCEMVGINSKYLSCIETASSIPSLEVLVNILIVLGMSPNDVLIQYHKAELEVHESSPEDNYNSSSFNTAQYNILSKWGKQYIDSLLKWISYYEAEQNSTKK